MNKLNFDDPQVSTVLQKLFEPVYRSAQRTDKTQSALLLGQTELNMLTKALGRSSLMTQIEVASLLQFNEFRLFDLPVIFCTQRSICCEIQIPCSPPSTPPSK